MKNERSYVTRIQLAFEQQLVTPHVVTKHADRFTAHIPDLSIDYAGGTVWLEVKYLKTDGSQLWPRFKRQIPEAQLMACQKRYTATRGKCLYVVCFDEMLQVCVPAYLLRQIYGVRVPDHAFTEGIRYLAGGERYRDLVDLVERLILK